MVSWHEWNLDQYIQIFHPIQIFFKLLKINLKLSFLVGVSEADLGLLQHPRWSALCNYYHKALHLGCCHSPRSVSGFLVNWLVLETNSFRDSLKSLKCSVSRGVYNPTRDLFSGFSFNDENTENFKEVLKMKVQKTF